MKIFNVKSLASLLKEYHLNSNIAMYTTYDCYGLVSNVLPKTNAESP